MTSLQERLERKKNQVGLVGTRLKFSRPENGKGLSEYITHDWKEIVIGIRKNLDLAPDEQTRIYLRKVKVEDPVETVATDLLYHGCGHRELPVYTELGCPHNIQNHDRILSGVARALKEKGKEGLESYVANAFEDILDNTNARKHTRHAGQILFWNNEGLENNGEFTDFYEAFVKINLALWGQVADATLLRRFFTNKEEVQKAVTEFRDYLKRTLRTSSLVRTHEDEDQLRELFDKGKWEDLAYRFTLATADLLEHKPKMRLCFGHDPNEPTYFDKLIKLPENQEEIAFSRYKSGEGPSEHTDPILQLDSLYRRISKAIPIKTSEYTKTQGAPISHFGRRNLGEDESVKITRIKGLGFSDEGDLTLRVSKHELMHPATYKIHPRNFPRLKVALLDTSGSMAQSPENDSNVGDTSFIPWGDNSKYHYALKGLYGIDNFLVKQGIASYVQSEAVVFSDRTRKTGKRKLRSEEERRALLQKPSGGTSIDPSVLQSSLDERTFLISVSDGDIANWDQVKDNYKQVIGRADFCHIHIGDGNQFTRDLEDWGVKVYYVKGDEGLSKLMIDAASKYYRDSRFT